MSSPKLTAVLDLTQLGALLRVGGEDFQDHILADATRALADVLTGAPLAQATKRVG